MTPGFGMSGPGLLVMHLALEALGFCRLTGSTGAEEAATDGGMMSHPLDLGYMGVYTIWTNNLGE